MVCFKESNFQISFEIMKSFTKLSTIQQCVMFLLLQSLRRWDGRKGASLSTTDNRDAKRSHIRAKRQDDKHDQVSTKIAGKLALTHLT